MNTNVFLVVDLLNKYQLRLFDFNKLEISISIIAGFAKGQDSKQQMEHM